MHTGFLLLIGLLIVIFVICNKCKIIDTYMSVSGVSRDLDDNTIMDHVPGTGLYGGRSGDDVYDEGNWREPGTPHVDDDRSDQDPGLGDGAWSQYMDRETNIGFF